MKINVVIVVPADRKGPLIDRTFCKGSELVISNTNSPLPITQAEYDKMRAA